MVVLMSLWPRSSWRVRIGSEIRSPLPKKRHAYVGQTMRDAEKSKSADKACKRLQALVSCLEHAQAPEEL